MDTTKRTRNQTRFARKEVQKFRCVFTKIYLTAII